MLRKMRPFDLEALMELWFAGNRAAHAFIDPAYWERQRGAVRKAIAEADVTVFEQAGRIEGFLGLTGQYVAGIFVRQDCRCRGIGGQLIAHCQKQRDWLELHVYEKNERALRFYKAHGFEVKGKGVQPETGAVEVHMVWQKSRKD